MLGIWAKIIFPIEKVQYKTYSLFYPSLIPYLQAPETETKTDKLFPIFYNKITANSQETAPILSQASDTKKFVCNSLSENQTIIDAGQKVIGKQEFFCGWIF